MKEVFNCLDPNTEILGHKVLQASAGTGKTFAIEHIVLRLLLQGIALEKILVVTFTNLATNELRQRIRGAIENAVQILSEQLKSENILYLDVYKEDSLAIERLKGALYSFDEAQIFTIHSFCNRMILEFAFEAKIVLTNIHSFDSNAFIKETIKKYFLYHLDSSICLSSQMYHLTRQMDMETLISVVINRLSKKLLKIDFDQMLNEISRLFKESGFENLNFENLFEDFEQISINYKKSGFSKEDFELQIQLLAKLSFSPNNRKLIDQFLLTKASLLNFLSEKNRKKNDKDISALHYPAAFDFFKNKLKEKIDKLLDANLIIEHLTQKMRPFVYQKLKEKEIILPDDFLFFMEKSLENPIFCQKVKQKYSAAIIDEFQDTDPLQWKIFKKLFVNNHQILSFFLVGDPKQSIYGFRNADIYTYLKAAKDIGLVLHLDTNYRSDHKLIHSLNVFFEKSWLYLPKENRTLPYLPVKAGSSISFEDIHKPLHFMIAEDGPNLEEEVFFPYICQEIERLHKKKEKYSHFAILVKDRYQEEKLLSFCNKANIPSSARMRPLKDTYGFKVFVEMFKAIENPSDISKVNIALANLFSEDALLSHHQYFYQLHHDLAEFKMEKCLSTLFTLSFDGKDLLSRLPEDAAHDFLECTDSLLNFLNNQMFTKQLFEEFVKQIQTNSEQRILTNVEDAVQILTIHKSKGLEFDIVFCLGLGFSYGHTDVTGEGPQEVMAEKLRQQYVAMTRAKKKVYAPIILTNKTKFSPMNLFLKSQEVEQDNLFTYLEKNREHFSFTNLSSQKMKSVQSFEKPSALKADFFHFEKKYLSKRKILSFSSIGHSSSNPIAETIDDLPQGTKTGVVIHQIMEKALFSSEFSLEFIKKHLAYTHLEGREAIIYEMLQKVFTIQLAPKDFCLSDVNPNHFFTEMEFVYPVQNNHFKGFIDVIFKHEGKYYLLDWKTNTLPSYTQDALEEAMIRHDYFLQAAIYTEGVKRAIKHFEKNDFEGSFGGVFYLFLRGIKNGQGIYYFMPDLKRIEDV